MANDLNYNVHFSSDLPQLSKQIEQAAKQLEHLSPGGKNSTVSSSFTQIEKAIDRIIDKTSRPIKSFGEMNSIANSVDTVSTKLARLQEQRAKLSKLSNQQKIDIISESSLINLTKAGVATDTFVTKLQSLQTATRKVTDDDRQLAAATKEVERVQKSLAQKTALKEKYEEEAKAIRDFLEVKKLYEQQGADKRKNLTRGGKTYSYFASQNAVKRNSTFDPKDTQALQGRLENLEGSKGTQGSINTTANEIANLTQKLQVAQTEHDKLEVKIKGLNASFKTNNVQAQNQAWQQYCQALTEAGVSLEGVDVNVGYSEQSFQLLQSRLEELGLGQIEQFNSNLASLETTMASLAGQTEQLSEETDKYKREVRETDQQMSDVSMITSRIKQYVGLYGAINVLRTVINRALSTIKELDQTMTEMSVVTDESIGGYWDQLPTYTERANKLGVAINDVYEADTLLYQQGNI